MKLRSLKSEPPAKFWKGKRKAHAVHRYGKGGYVQRNASTKTLDKVA